MSKKTEIENVSNALMRIFQERLSHYALSGKARYIIAEDLVNNDIGTKDRFTITINYDLSDYTDPEWYREVQPITYKKGKR